MGSPDIIPVSAAALILRESRRLFERHGFAKTTTSDIASACKMSPGNLYRHYRNKRAIGQAVVDAFVAEYRTEVASAMTAPAQSVEERMRRVLTVDVLYSIRKLREAPKLIELAEMIFESEEGRELIAEVEGQQEKAMRGLIEEGVAAGEFQVEDAGRAARGVISGLKYFATPITLVRHGLDQAEADFAIVLDLICAGLRHGLRR